MKIAKLISKILFNICVVLLGFTFLASTLSRDPQIEDILSENLFGKGTTEIINTGKPPVRYKTWYSNVNDVINGNGDIAKAAEAEGITLLKNDNNALPLNIKTDKVSLFGVTAYDMMYSLDGAGEVKINKARQEFLYNELKNAGLKMNEGLMNWYNGNTQYWREDYINIYDNTTNKNGVNANINGAPWGDLPADKANEGFNTAIFVVGRMTNEGIDITPNRVNNKGAKDNDYLKFTDNELSVLNGMHELKKQHKLDKIVVLFNQANPMQEDLPKLLNDYGVDSALWIGFPGSDGLTAVADVLTGRTCPSGGLSTTWYSGRGYNPSTPYYGRGDNVLIQEGVYLGYKYAETRYEDKVLGQGNTEAYDYSKAIAYPFGYGLSYSDFEIKLGSLEADLKPAKSFDAFGKKLPADQMRKPGDDLILNVSVKNTGKVAAKEIVQIYLQKPYTAQNKTNKVEKPAVELIAFAKTKKLKPGEADNLKIKIDVNKFFASFDITQGKYIMDEGSYYLSAARNSHEAINSILMQKKADGISVNEANMDNEFGTGDKALVKKHEITSSYTSSYEYWTQGGSKVTSLFDEMDPNKASGNPNAVTYMSRANWLNTADNAQNQIVKIEGDMSRGDIFHRGNNWDLENIEKYYKEAMDSFENKYPNYGLHINKGVAEIQLSDMVGVEYLDRRGATEESKAKWEKFLDQLTWEETCTLVGNGLRRTVAIESIGKPYTNDVNASNGISWMFDMKKGGSGDGKVGFAYRFDQNNRMQNPTGYPCEGIIAATYNTELAFAVGQAIGEDGLWSGAAGLYGFGLGLHRNPYHGRAGEYYSDDPVLSGIIGGYESKGAQSKGLYVYNKHFILNDQEENRTGYKTWLNEQAFRETYIRPFELAIEIGDAMNVMNSFNKVGSYWSGNNYNLMTKCLRGELGMRGFAVTDYWKSGGMNLLYGLLAGTDLPDGNGAQGDILSYGPANGEFGFYAQAVRQSAQRILYTVANSNAMNFIGEGTIVNYYPPKWLETRDRVTTGLYASLSTIAALCAVVYVFDRVKSYLDRRAK